MPEQQRERISQLARWVLIGAGVVLLAVLLRAVDNTMYYFEHGTWRHMEVER